MRTTFFAVIYRRDSATAETFQTIKPFPLVASVSLAKEKLRAYVREDNYIMSASLFEVDTRKGEECSKVGAFSRTSGPLGAGLLWIGEYSREER